MPNKSILFFRRVAVVLYRSAWVRIAVATLLVCLGGFGGMFHELDSIRKSTGKSLIAEVRSHAVRTVERLEQDMEQFGVVDLNTAAKSHWLRDRWRSIRLMEPKRSYRAVVDMDGTILSHTSYRKAGQIIKPLADGSRVPEWGDAVFETQDPILTDNLRVVDILVPIYKSNTLVGTYHVGLPADWLRSKIATEQSASKRAWTAVIIYTMAIMVVTGVVLHLQSRRARLLERELHRSEEGRLRELNSLMVGMAHEVRNPLNSIRLNLHTSDRIFRGVSQLGEQEVASMIADSVREIERVESLIGQLLGYARMENEFDDDVDLADEIQTAIRFMQTSFEQQVITVHFRNNASSVNISIDRRRLRQILLNLMKNAVEAMPSGGHIELTLETKDNQARLTIADSGTGVDAKIRSRLFEPFVTTRESGTGMGLAIVRRIIDSMDGAIHYQTSGSLGGAEFSLSFPIDYDHRRSKHAR